jgi:signal transduction histidine kinase
MKEPSLFKRLFVTLSGLLLLLFCLSCVLIYHSISEHLNQSKDAELVSNSHILWDILKDEISDDKHPEKPGSGSLSAELHAKIGHALSQYPKWQAFRVWKDHTLIFKSGNSGLLDTPEATPDFSNKKLGNEAWRTYAFYVREEDIIIEVSENMLSRKLLIRSIFEGFLESWLLLLPLLGVLLYVCLRYSLSSLIHMEKRLEERGPQSLEYINIDTIPQELKPLQRAINFLIDKLKDNITYEKQLIDNAAHELRTPLAALRLHAQLAAEANTENDRTESMKDLFSTITQATQLVNQLLALSRLAVDQVIRQPVTLYAIAARVLQAHQTAAKHLRLSLEGDETATASSQEELLGILLRVLLDNAIKYSPDGGRIKMQVGQDLLTLSDEGPGIPAEEKEKVFERFYRGKHAVQGNGLGLAIAKQICALLGITITLADTPGSGGLQVQLLFPENTEC